MKEIFKHYSEYQIRRLKNGEKLIRSIVVTMI